ncbi:MAG: 50S ribosomal protein L11 methyltransferase [Gammaproteobacteria bacterium]|nr:50S ribosomal protein L11 methyltransferase [Gammaproteobacteria bacterium]
MDWQQFVMDLKSLNAEHVEEIFARHGAFSVTLTDAADNPVLEPAAGETPLWSDTRITALFSADADLVAVTDDLVATLGVRRLPPHRIKILADRAWEREWLKDFAPMRFGNRLWICPGDTTAPDDSVVVHLDPGLAFGTGTHPTTALCLDWLDGRDLDGRTVLDYGCGSGVLAIAATKLGCRSATAMDIDPQAVTATLANAAHNGVANSIQVLADDATITGHYDIVVANILAGPLIELAESISMRLSSGGELALSGILSDQVNKIQAAYGPWIELDAPVYRSQGDQTWALLSGNRRDS